MLGSSVVFILYYKKQPISEQVEHSWNVSEIYSTEVFASKNDGINIFNRDNTKT